MTPNIHFENREIEGERLDLTDKTAIYWLGPNVTLRDCTLVTNISARWLHLVSGTLIDCTIQAKSELKTLPWAQMKLKGCRFKGRFTGNDFGFREDLDERRKLGGIEDCDFSEARLNGCRFFNCDMSTIRLPRWPCFTFLDARQHAAELGRRGWPGSFGVGHGSRRCRYERKTRPEETSEPGLRLRNCSPDPVVTRGVAT